MEERDKDNNNEGDNNNGKTYPEQMAPDEEAGWKCLNCGRPFDFDLSRYNYAGAQRDLERLEVREDLRGFWYSRVPIMMGGCAHTICAVCYKGVTREQGFTTFGDNNHRLCIRNTCPLCKKKHVIYTGRGPNYPPVNASLVMARNKGFTAMVDLSQDTDEEEEDDERKMPANEEEEEDNKKMPAKEMPEQKEELEDRFRKARAQSEEWRQVFENATEQPFIGPRDHCTRKKADSVNAKQALMDKKMPADSTKDNKKTKRATFGEPGNCKPSKTLRKDPDDDDNKPSSPRRGVPLTSRLLSP